MNWEIIVPKDFDVNKKSYIIKGKSYVRVTRSLDVISKPGLIIWFQKVGKRASEKVIKDRQILGTQAHSLFEKICKDEPIDSSGYHDEIQMDIRLFRNFKEKCIVSVDALEQRLWSRKHGYGGTTDFIGYYKTNKEWLVRGQTPKFDDRIPSFVIGDWKTSRDIYPEYWLQLAAYCVAFKELTGVEPAGAFIAHFRNGKIRIKEKTYKELLEEFKTYKAVLVLYRWQNKGI